MLSNFCKTYKSTEIFFSCLNIPSSLPRYGISSACDWCWEKSQGGKWKLKVWTVSSDPSPPPTYFHNKCSVIEFVLRTLREQLKLKRKVIKIEVEIVASLPLPLHYVRKRNVRNRKIIILNVVMVFRKTLLSFNSQQSCFSIPGPDYSSVYGEDYHM